ncbi:MAG: maleylpyruvate isomerase family mycothiol-dependent enzyme [Actinomycetales bacterium]|nr:maleylpyruvate isomerase family mycothiol-dependent enzyme [Actinomycetales bacterium]
MTTWSDHDLIDIWNESLDDVLVLIGDVTDEQWQAPTPCPGWSVGDIVAHLVDVEGVLAKEPRPDHEPDWEALNHVANDIGRFTEVGVDYRRGTPKEDVTDELRGIIATRRRQLDDVPPGEGVLSVMGNPTTIDRLLHVRTLDIWMHEQDIRVALGRDGGWDTRPAQVSLEQIRRALPYVWARTCQAPEGSTVRVTVTGPGLTAQLAAVVGPEGKGTEMEPPSEATVHLTLAWPDLVALSAGRIDPDEPDLRARITLEGDPQLAETLLRALAITP